MTGIPTPQIQYQPAPWDSWLVFPGMASDSESGAGSKFADEALPDLERPTGVEGLGLAGVVVDVSNLAFLAEIW